MIIRYNPGNFFDQKIDKVDFFKFENLNSSKSLARFPSKTYFEEHTTVTEKRLNFNAYF